MSTPATTSQSEPFAERVSRLFRELDRAIKWNRPAILLAIYSSEFVRADAEAELAARLRERGQTISTYRVAGEEQADIPLHLSQHPDRKHTVFFVSGLRWGGGPDERSAYRALNIRREYFVDHRIRAVFWLTESEAIGLPRYAPDFWAFRHRVVEFVEAPQGEQIDRTASDLTWRDFQDHTLRENTDAKIALREALLSDLPDSDETLATRGELLYTLAGLYWAKQDYDRSITLFQNALKVAEQLDDAHLHTLCYNGLGNVYGTLGRNEEAIAAYLRAIDLTPKSALPHNGLGITYRALGRNEEAIAAYLRAIDLNPKYGAPHNGLGNVYTDLGRNEEAIAAYLRASELDPKLALPHNGLGNVYADLGRNEEAIAAYLRASELDPKLANPHNGLGSTYYTLGRNEEAITAYQRAIELDPKDALPHSNLGNLYRTLGRTEEAIVAHLRASELDPKDASLHNSLGNIYADQGYIDEAIVAYQHAIDLDPKDAYYPYYNLGNVYARLKQYKDSIAAYRKAISLEPKRVLARASLAGCYRRLHRNQNYAEQVKLIIPLLDRANEYERALFKLIRGDVDAALALLEVALQKNQVAPAWVRRDPDFAALGDDPRFQALVGTQT